MSLSEWQRIRVNGHCLSYRTVGAIHMFPVIFMHGGTQDGNQWKIPVLRLFVKHGYYCIVLNRLGFGKYSDEEEEWAADYYQQHTADFLAFLDALHIKRCAVVSWCDGANISLMAAAQRPTAFAGIVASVPHLKISNSQEEIDYAVASMKEFPEMIKSNTAYWKTLERQYGSEEQAKRIFDRWYKRSSNLEWMLQKDLTACLTKVECPVFVTIAGKDNFFLPATGLAILPLIQNVQHWIAEESGHMIHTSSGPQAAEFFARSLAFLNSLSLTAKL
uniref:AB hydrolase-1 domain-containing protein n=1 Tax=Vannella robusta TaxID=1487602 RepID=A0A7S4IFP8_9EUKA|mmetsp:Transcript_25168/g.32017  ORF Transcript_25168/g.32017 Transcript_25168/m.32017 type:complete len:275 (+) Transcript_25168:494-1318(+)